MFQCFFICKVRAIKLNKALVEGIGSVQYRETCSVSPVSEYHEAILDTEQTKRVSSKSQLSEASHPRFIFILWVFDFCILWSLPRGKKLNWDSVTRIFGLEDWRLQLFLMPSFWDSIPIPNADRIFLASSSERNEWDKNLTDSCLYWPLTRLISLVN